MGAGKGPGIASVLARRPPTEAGETGAEEEDEELGPAPPSKEELAAMRSFDSAKSPDDRAVALKQFIKLCGGY